MITYLNQFVSKDNKIYWLGLVVLMSITNPSLEAHKNEVIFNMGPMAPEGREFYRSTISRNNFLLFSFTKTNKHQGTWSRKKVGWSRIVGIGILGQVYIFTDSLE